MCGAGMNIFGINILVVNCIQCLLCDALEFFLSQHYIVIFEVISNDVFARHCCSRVNLIIETFWRENYSTDKIKYFLKI